MLAVLVLACSKIERLLARSIVLSFQSSFSVKHKSRNASSSTSWMPNMSNPHYLHLIDKALVHCCLMVGAVLVQNNHFAL